MPITDYEGQQEILERALKRSLLRQQAPEPEGRMVSGHYVPAGYGRYLARALEQVGGREGQQGAESAIMALRQQQLQEAQALGQELNTPGNVPVPEGQAGPPAPMDPLQENQRRMGVATRMSMLPMTKGLGNQIINQGVAFPEKLAQIQAKAEEQQALQRLRGDDQRSIAELRTVTEMEKQRLHDQFMASQNALYRTLGGARGGANDDLQRAILEERLKSLEAKNALPTSEQQFAKLPVKAQGQGAALQNLESGFAAYRNALQGYNPKSNDALNLTKRAAVSAIATDLAMRLKDSYELGAITGPDMRILEGVITDPTSFIGTTKGAIVGNKGFEAQIEEGNAALARTKQNFRQLYGIDLPSAAGRTMAEMPPSAPPTAVQLKRLGQDVGATIKQAPQIDWQRATESVVPADEGYTPSPLLPLKDGAAPTVRKYNPATGRLE
jgi:hypothetical protein